MKSFLLLGCLLIPSLVLADDVRVLSAARARGASSADAPDIDLDPAVVLARMCVQEAGFNAAETGDCPAIRVVLNRVGRGDVVQGARLYSPNTFRVRSPSNRPWLTYLDRTGAQPRYWPRNWSWANHQPRWVALIEQAREWIANDFRPCSPQHWGDRHDDQRRAERLGWERVDCGSETQNLFWRRPQRPRS